jgi:type IV secretion system protein VirB6
MAIKDFIKIIFSLMGLAFLAGCDAHPCIDADDFGLPKLFVNSQYTNTSDFLSADGDKTDVIKWQDQNLILTGSRLFIVVRDDADRSTPSNYMYDKYNPNQGVSRWSPWGTYAGTDDITDIFNLPQECQFQNNQMCQAGLYEAPITNAPCYFRLGIGLYMLLMAPNAGDPNSSVNASSNPESVFGNNAMTYHLGQGSENDRKVFNYNNIPPVNFAKGRLYFKILDNFYKDNLGGYQIIIKQGVQQGDWSFLQQLLNYVKTKLTTVYVSIFDNIIQSFTFKVLVKYSLIIFIMYSGVKFTLGLSEISQREFAIQIFKIGIVLTLVSDTSWNFFNNYLFNVFFSGMDSIVNLINSNGTDAFFSLDGYIKELLSYETSKKIQGAIWGSKQKMSAILAVIALYIAVVFIFILMVKAMIIYCLSLISISLLISMAPFFIVFALYGFLKELFDNWLQQITTKIVEMILVAAFLALFSSTMLQYLHYLLGYKVCFTGVEKISVFGQFGYTKPEVNFDVDPLPSIYVPEAPKNAENTCQPYECQQQRYPDLPYLDPNDPDDAARIEEIKAQDYITLKHAVSLILTIYFMYVFFDNIPGIGAGIVGGMGYSQGAQRQLVSAYGSMITGMINNGLKSIGGGIYGGVDKMTGGRLEKAREGLGNIRDKIGEVGGEIVSSAKTFGVKSLAKVGKSYYEEKVSNNVTDIYNYHRNNIGKKIDAYEALGKMAKNDLLYQVSFGMMGESSSKKVVDPMTNKESRLSQRELNLELYGKDLNWSPDKIQRMKTITENMSETLSSSRKYAAAAVGLGILVTPVAGLIVAGVYGAKVLKDYKKIQDEVQRAEIARRGLNDPTPPGLAGQEGVPPAGRNIQEQAAVQPRVGPNNPPPSMVNIHIEAREVELREQPRSGAQLQQPIEPVIREGLQQQTIQQAQPRAELPPVPQSSSEQTGPGRVPESIERQGQSTVQSSSQQLRGDERQLEQSPPAVVENVQRETGRSEQPSPQLPQQQSESSVVENVQRETGRSEQPSPQLQQQQSESSVVENVQRETGRSEQPSPQLQQQSESSVVENVQRETGRSDQPSPQLPQQPESSVVENVQRETGRPEQPSPQLPQQQSESSVVENVQREVGRSEPQETASHQTTRSELPQGNREKYTPQQSEGQSSSAIRPTEQSSDIGSSEGEQSKPEELPKDSKPS